MKLSYISNNCMGGLMFQHFNEQYTNPFIWSLILDDKQFIDLCINYDKYIQESVSIVKINEKSRWCNDTKKTSYNDWEYPTLDLSGIEMGTSIYLDALKLPAGAKAAHPDRDHVLATIVAPSGATEEAAAPTTAA